jgi:phosphoenolpyruvate carboxykinase (ATP)
MPFSVFASDVIKERQPSLRLSAYINYQSTPDELVQDTLRTGEGYLTDTGALLVCTGTFTGRSPKDRFIVRDNLTATGIDWNEFNLSIAPHYYFEVYEQVIRYLNQKSELWMRDAYACADERFKLNIRVISEKPWHNLFCHNMFLRPERLELKHFQPDWHVFSVPGLTLDPAICGTRQGNATIINFSERTILITGSGYTGETKKGIFTVLNYLMPKACVLSMHCAANMGAAGDTAIFFGLSGTGKTTLSADPSRRLIGDDEHGWTEDSVFNFEGGCYAKTIDLSREKEPEIFNAIRPGALLENSVFYKGTNTVNYSDGSITENARVSYPLPYISNAAIPAVGGVPKNVFFLTCDASGVLPPISRLTPEQAMYQFISGYTAKIAGTETGITEPKPTFSACFGAPFLPLHPGRYAEMLGKKIKQHQVNIWLVNTGWTGGTFGKGKRIALNHTRSMITAVLEAQLNTVPFHKHAVFGFQIPETCPGVPQSILDPRNAWEDKVAYDRAANQLAILFRNNFEKYANGVEAEVLQAAPLLT